jgi:hypothetical protein
MSEPKQDAPQERPERGPYLPDYGTPLLAASAFVAPVVGLFTPRGMVVLLVLCAVPAFFERDIRRLAIGKLRGRVGLLLVALMVWGGLTALWSPVPAATALAAAKVAGVIAAAFLALAAAERLEDEQADMLHTAVLAGLAFGLVLLAVEVIFNSPIRRLIEPPPDGIERQLPWWLNRGISVAVLLVWPAALVCWHRFGAWAATVPLLVLAAIVAAGPQRSALVALPLGYAAAMAALLLGSRVFPLVAAALAAFALAAPIWVKALPEPTTVRQYQPEIAASFVHRLHVWQFTSEQIGRKPLHGWGLRASRAVPGGEQLIDFGGKRPGKAMPLHPHNGSLQIWLELGALGVLIAAIFLYVAIARLGRLDADRPGYAALAAVPVAGFTYANLSYGIWQTWWLAALALALMLTIATARVRPG